MPIIDPDTFEFTHRPELVIGVVAAVGTPLDYVCRTLETILRERHYEVATIRLSDQLANLTLQPPHPPDRAPTYDRITTLMDRGNELRRIADGGEALALIAVARISERRGERGSDGGPPCLPGHAFVLRQLKHPDEVLWLRRIYGDAFHLIGVYCPEAVRCNNLVLHGNMEKSQARALIQRDEGEEQSYGQQLRDTYYRSDVFVRLDGHDDDATLQMKEQLERYFRLLFGELGTGVITPSVDEYGMYLAQAAALRSADLSRQVGAAILSRNRELLALGANEVPSAGGGQYWPDQSGGRDCDLGVDSNAQMKRRILGEVLVLLNEGFGDLNATEQDERIEAIAKRLGSARVMNLTEFGRAVHAEMEALLAAGRIGVSTRDATLYTSTFPCHNCAKHIVGAGITRVVYVEPYPKSLAQELHGDSIAFLEEPPDRKVLFDSFVGVAPRRYEALFSVVSPDGRSFRRKEPRGSVRRDSLGLRLRSEVWTYIDRETMAAQAAARVGQVQVREELVDEQEGNAS